MTKIAVILILLFPLISFAQTTKINGLEYGPIAALVGQWQGDKGVDVAPGQPVPKTSLYFETIDVSIVGDVLNANKQKLSVLSYHQQVFRKEDNKKFHDQVGYWIYDPASKEIHHTVAIPRAVTLVASGKADENGKIVVSTDSEIGQSAFMREQANTSKFEMTLSVSESTLSYTMTTHLNIYGQPFPHLDSNQLTKVNK